MCPSFKRHCSPAHTYTCQPGGSQPKGPTQLTVGTCGLLRDLPQHRGSQGCCHQLVSSTRLPRVVNCDKDVVFETDVGRQIVCMICVLATQDLSLCRSPPRWVVDDLAGRSRSIPTFPGRQHPLRPGFLHRLGLLRACLYCPTCTVPNAHGPAGLSLPVAGSLQSPRRFSHNTRA
ncbi:hypothetical protein VTK26DRAFT_3073 [Humicola hyalothermophila]